MFTHQGTIILENQCGNKTTNPRQQDNHLQPDPFLNCSQNHASHGCHTRESHCHIPHHPTSFILTGKGLQQRVDRSHGSNNRKTDWKTEHGSHPRDRDKCHHRQPDAQ